MSGRIRLLVSDIDGTLVRHDKTLSDAVVTAAKQCREAGVALSLISARPPSGMLWIAAKLGLTSVVGAFNGGTLVKPDGTIVFADRLDPAHAAHTLALLDAPGVTPWLFADGKWYARTADSAYVARERLAAHVEPVVLGDFGALLAHVDKIVGVSDDHDLLAKLEGKIAEALGSGATVVRSQPYYLDVTAPGGNKGAGVTALAKVYGVTLAEVAVIGDQNNDLAMFKVAGLSIAMGQAPDHVRAAAKHIALSNDADGVADAIRRFVLPAAAPAKAAS